MARRALVAALLALAMMASAFRFTAAPGPGLDPDAMSYLGAARAFVADGALRVPTAPWSSDSTTEPLSHFPPGYSLALAGPIALGADAVRAARLVQALAAGITVAAFVLALWPFAGAWGAAIGAVSLALVPSVTFVHLSVLSEPLFLMCVMLAWWSFTRRPRSAWLHGLLAAAATMVRYAGLSVAAAAALWALRDATASWRDRLRRAAFALAPSLLAMGAWSLTRARAAGQDAEPIRTVAVYGDWGPTLNEGLRTIAHQLAPTNEWEPVPWLAAGATLVAMAALVWSTVRASGEVLPDAARDDPRWEAQRTALAAAGWLALSYVGLVVASRAFADPIIPFDFRITVPLAPLAVAAVTIVAARAWRVISRPARVFGVLALLGWAAAAVRADRQQVVDVLADGSDFSTSDWRHSPTLAWVRTQDQARVLYTNWPCAVWFHLDRRVRGLPESLHPDSLQRFVARVRDAHGALVAWTIQSSETANTDSIVARTGLVRVATFADGAVYEAPPPSAPPGTLAPAPPTMAPALPRR